MGRMWAGHPLPAARRRQSDLNTSQGRRRARGEPIGEPGARGWCQYADGGDDGSLGSIRSGHWFLSRAPRRDPGLYFVQCL